MWGIKVFFLYAPRRVDCPDCGILVERMPWSKGKHRLTEAYAWFLAGWAKRLSWKEVAEAFAVLSDGKKTVALVALDSSLREDLYLFVQGFAEDGTVELQAFVNPLIIWLWIGGAIFITGGLLAFAPAAAPSRETVDASAGATQRA